MHTAHKVARLEALRQPNLLDTPRSERFDRIMRRAARIFNLPIAAISRTDTDRQGFKSRIGAPCAEIAATAAMRTAPGRDEAQRYAYARPLETDAFAAWCDRFNAANETTNRTA